MSPISLLGAVSSNHALSAGSVMASQSSWLLTFVSESNTWPLPNVQPPHVR